MLGAEGVNSYASLSAAKCVLYMCELLQIPTIGFLYIAGWIGYVGRDYLIASKAESKPTQKEIIIDVPMALKMAAQVTPNPSSLNSQSCRGTLWCRICQCC